MANCNAAECELRNAIELPNTINRPSMIEDPFDGLTPFCDLTAIRAPNLTEVSKPR